MNKKQIINYFSANINMLQSDKDIILQIQQAREELEIANKCFQMVKDPKLIDYAIYKEQAAKARYEYLISEARKKNISVDTSCVLIDVN